MLYLLQLACDGILREISTQSLQRIIEDMTAGDDRTHVSRTLFGDTAQLDATRVKGRKRKGAIVLHALGTPGRLQHLLLKLQTVKNDIGRVHTTVAAGMEPDEEEKVEVLSHHRTEKQAPELSLQQQTEFSVGEFLHQFCVHVTEQLLLLDDMHSVLAGIKKLDVFMQQPNAVAVYGCVSLSDMAGGSRVGLELQQYFAQVIFTISPLF